MICDVILLPDKSFVGMRTVKLLNTLERVRIIEQKAVKLTPVPFLGMAAGAPSTKKMVNRLAR